MATVETVKEKLQGLIDRSNGVTGENHENLSDAVDALAAGYGQGGGVDELMRAVVERALTKVIIPEGVKIIGGSAFQSCNLLNEISIPDSVTEIGNNAFHGCVAIKELKLPEALVTLNANVFFGCTGLVITEIPPTVQTISTNVFYRCLSFTKLTFLGTPSSIGTSAFNSCTNLADIYVPWAEGAVANAPWGAINATVHYNYTGEEGV